MGFVGQIGYIAGFDEENEQSDPPKSVFGGGDPSLTVMGIGSTGFRVGPGGLGGWVGPRVPMDIPTKY